MLRNVTYSSSVLHFVAKNHNTENIRLKEKKIISLECTVSCQMSAVQFVLVRHR